MKKRKDSNPVINLSIAMLCIALAAYIAGTKSSSQKLPESPSPDEMAESQSKGIRVYFNLNENEQKNVYHLYKDYDEIRMSYNEKIREAETNGVFVSKEDTRQFAHAITIAKQNLEAGMKAILTEAEYEEWRKKERRAQVTYNSSLK